MNNWRKPITDRTLQDVKNVDVGSLEYQKGTLNADDLNRIEDNYKYLMAKLRSDAIFIPHRLRNYTETVLEYVEKENSILPSGYTQLESIAFTGTQYFDLGFKPNQDTRVVVDIDVTANSGQSCIFGSRNAYHNNAFLLFTATNNAGYQCDYANTGVDSTSTKSSGRHILDFNKNVFSIDGIVEYTHTYTAFSSSYDLYLLSINNGGSAMTAYPVSGKLYSAKAYSNVTLIRDLVPCKNSSGTVGLYDLVGSKFYTNAGSGTFAAGMEVEAETVYELIETQTTYTDWQENNLPWMSEINRIRANYNALMRLFLVGMGFSEQAESNYLDYQEVNNWERIAEVGKTMFENMEKEYRYCGMEESGGDRLL